MPKLGDYIGHLLSEITIARMHADLEAVRVAELYAGHPLLRYMPVPRFRMPNVEMDVPIVVKALEPSDDDSPYGNPPVAEMRKVFDGVLTSILTKEKITLSAAVQKKLKTILDERVVALSGPTEIEIDMNRVSLDFSVNAMKALGEVIKPEKRAEFEKRLKDSLLIESIKICRPPTRLIVLVTTAEIREAGPNEVITHLRLKISEEAFEWTTIESDEGRNDRLVIE